MNEMAVAVAGGIIFGNAVALALANSRANGPAGVWGISVRSGSGQ